MQKQSYTISMEGTNSSGNIGVAGNLSYMHRNLFRNAIQLKYKIGGGYQNQTNINSEDKILLNTTEFNTEAQIIFPSFLFIERRNSEKFHKKFAPKTNISISYNYQQRTEYTRRIINSFYAYNWKLSNNFKHIFTPISINIVDLPFIDSSFYANINNPYIKNSYKD